MNRPGEREREITMQTVVTTFVAIAAVAAPVYYALFATPVL
ncbi:MAG: hypothetical protein AAFR11_03850 [Pseudomonadota bacterium]